MARIRRYWVIEGFESGKRIYQCEIPAGSIPNIKELMRCLAAKAGLTFDEIVGAHGKRRTHIHNSLLEVTRDGPLLRYSCGENPYFTARMKVNTQHEV